MSEVDLPNTAGAHAVLEVLRAWGVDRVFTCPGSTEAALLDASLGVDDVELVLTTHESIAVGMADGYARASGRPSVAYLHTNIGLANGLAHLACAQVAGSPVVVLNGLKTTHMQAVRGFTTTPYVRDLARVHCRWEWQTLSSERLVADVDEAFRQAMTPPTGPTWLGLPQNLLETCDAKLPGGLGARPPVRAHPDPAAVEAAARLLARARRPVVVAGSDVARTGAHGALDAVAKRLDAPLLEEDRWSFEVAVVPAAHPGLAGALAANSEVVRGCDFVVLAGARSPVLNEPVARPPLPEHVPVVHLHPDPGELGRHVPTAMSLLGDADLGLAALARALPEPSPDVARERREFREAAVEGYRRARDRRRRTALELRAEVPIRLEALMASLADHVTDRTVVVADAVTSEPALFAHVPRLAAGSYLTSVGGSLGWGLPAALGVALGRPDREVLAVLGDGVVQFGVQALWSAARLGSNVIFLVVNNQAYAAVRTALYRYGGRAARDGTYPATSLTGANLAAVAAGFGVPSRRVVRLGELAPALAEARGRPGPAFVEVLTDPDDFPRPPRRSDTP